jgi:D-alanine-D-alanine ligase-like ATP-grasp enzyme
MERFDDKEFVNDLLRARGGFILPKSWAFEVIPGLSDSELESEVEKHLAKLEPEMLFPIVGKPIRGRGSYGVKVCRSLPELQSHLVFLLRESPRVMIEEFLPGEEATITVMPPSSSNPHYRALPAITRFNHADGVAPYNGLVAVTANSGLVTTEEYAKDPAYEEAGTACAAVSEILGLTAMMRIDIRRVKFAIFDVNVKPVSLHLCKERLDVRRKGEGGGDADYCLEYHRSGKTGQRRPDVSQWDGGVGRGMEL